MDTSKQKDYEIACKNGNLPLVIKYFGKYDYEANQYCGFINACENGHLDIVDYLVETHKKLNIHYNKDEGFVLACWKNHLDLAKYLYELKPNKIEKIILKGPPLIGCIPTPFGDIAFDTFTWLLNEFGKHGKDIISDENKADTCISCAERGAIREMKMLIEQEQLNLLNFEKYLHDTIYWSCRNYHLSILQYLYEKYNDNVDWQNTDGVEYLLTCEKDHLEKGDLTEYEGLISFLRDNNAIK